MIRPRKDTAADPPSARREEPRRSLKTAPRTADREWSAPYPPTHEPLPPSPDSEARRQQRELAARLLASGLGRGQASQLLSQQLSVSLPIARAVVGAIDREWSDELAEDLPRLKARQLERLQRDVARMRARPDPDYSRIARHEELIAKIGGTMAPVRVAVDVAVEVRASLLAVVAQLTPEEQDAIIAEQLALEARASDVQAAE